MASIGSIVRRPSSSYNNQPVPRPTQNEDLGSTDNKKESRRQSWSSIILRRTQSSSSIGNQNSSPADPDGSRRWSRYASRNSSTGSIVSIVQTQGQNVIDATARLIGGRRRRASDSAPATPSAGTPKQEPAFPLVDSLLIPRVTTGSPNTSSNNPPGRRPPILFYHKHQPYYGFTNFSNYDLRYEGKIYLTGEHLFQSLKFTHYPSLSEHIRTCSPRPSVAFSEARRFQPEVRKDWTSYKFQAMELAIFLKFSQHNDLRDELLSTGEAELILNSDKDSFWGCGPDGEGKNEFGKALERLREKLRD